MKYIFRAHSELKNIFQWDAFIKSLYDIADLFFNQEFDKHYPPEQQSESMKNFSKEQKFDLLLDWLGCEDKMFYNQKLKGF